MNSDRTTLATGYAAVFGFNLRQLKRYARGKLRLEADKTASNTEKLDEMTEIKPLLALSCA